MKLLYLDTMDLAQLAGGEGTNRLDYFKDSLLDAKARLVLSKFHLWEAVGVGVDDAKTRFMRFLDMGIIPLVFHDDPRDFELRYIERIVNSDSRAPLTTELRELTPSSLDEGLQEAAQWYFQLRELHSAVAVSEFFGVQANSKSDLVKISDTISQLEEAKSIQGFEAQCAQALNLDLEDKFDEATQRRFQKKTKETIAAAVEKARPYATALLPEPARILADLRQSLLNEEIDVDGVDCDMTWGGFTELVLIRQRGQDACRWAIPSNLVRFAVANLIPFKIDAMRHLDVRRIAEPGDYMDSLHAMHLPFVSVMTADKRTVEWLRASKNEKIADHAKRIFRGGNIENLKIALEALRFAPDAYCEPS